MNHTDIKTLNSEEIEIEIEKKKKLHFNFRRKNSLISIKKQPSINVSTLEVVLFILLVEVIHLLWKLKVVVTRS